MSAKTKTNTETLPVLPLRDIVIFPNMTVPLFVGRKQSIRMLEEAVNKHNGKFLALTQRDAGQDDPKAADVYQTGTICQVLQLLKLPDGTVKVLVDGMERAKASNINAAGQYWQATATSVEISAQPAAEVEAAARNALETFKQYLAMVHKISPEEIAKIENEVKGNPDKLANIISSQLTLSIADKQKLLEEPGIVNRFKQLLVKIEGELEVLQAQKRITRDVKESMEQTQREYYLREQMKAIKKELNDGEDDNEIGELKARIDATALPEAVRKKALKEIGKLEKMSDSSDEATVVRNWLEALLDLSWGKPTEVNNDINNAREILDSDHYGLDKVKDKIIENLAVQRRLANKGWTEGKNAQILCLVGPPGVGKTSLGESLARATGRNFIRHALGGVRDEAEIRGHRRTYIGSKPGAIIEKLTKAGSSNPLFMLDEIDKMGTDQRGGDPASALLEVLDSKQNHAFNDHYLDVDYDLSDVMFVCTANVLSNIPVPLQDRMDIVLLGSYTEDEKLEISKRHLVRKQMRANGFEEGEFTVTDDALRDIIRYYTRESGVRNLERSIATLMKKAAIELGDKGKTFAVTSDNLAECLGKRKFTFGLADQTDEIGKVTGLAWTEVGGETLDIEAQTWEVKDETGGVVGMSGQLGDVMKESITAASVLLKANAARFGIHPKEIFRHNYHVHVPAGAIPKDGPSAGAGMLTALFSVVAGKPVRKDVAMTGEVTTRGDILPIGGLREKLAAAVRGGYTTVLVPKENYERDRDEVPDQIWNALEVIPVSTIDEVLNHAIVGGFTPVITPALAATAIVDAPQPRAIN